ncbi:hypothetical protein [Rahnella inusitata]|uniref:hypothetical protein n=1 Tax=Rahnella inusitata TaxID=58169 RepID=UPI0039BE9FEA
MSKKIKFVVVGHHSRRNQAEQLACSLHAHLLIDEGDHGANWNHRRAIEWASHQDCRVVILEDDALLLPGFIESVSEWVSRFPDHLISFYLGTGRPPQYQQQIAMRLIDADKRQGDHITMDRLIHGVCYSPPVSGIAKILSNWNRNQAADYAVGDALGGQVIYPCYSLVDHADGVTVERHQDNEPRNERRRAWRLALSQTWSG